MGRRLEDRLEAVLLKYALRCEVVACDSCIEWPSGFQSEKLAQSFACEPEAPPGRCDPIGDFSASLGLETGDVADDLPAVDDCSVKGRGVAADLPPVTCEGRFVIRVFRGERCHVNGTRVALVVEEVREIFV